MSEELEKKIEEKLLIILNLIRTNSTGDDVLKITQGFANVTNGKNNLLVEGKTTPRKQGAGAS